MKLEKYEVNLKKNLTWKDIYFVRDQLSKYTDSPERMFDTIKVICDNMVSSIEYEETFGEELRNKKLLDSEKMYNFILKPSNTNEEELYKIIKEVFEVVKKK